MATAATEVQPSLFGPPPGPQAAAGAARTDPAEDWQADLAERLVATDPETLTPLEALNVLDEMVRTARSKQSC